MPRYPGSQSQQDRSAPSVTCPWGGHGESRSAEAEGSPGRRRRTLPELRGRCRPWPTGQPVGRRTRFVTRGRPVGQEHEIPPSHEVGSRWPSCCSRRPHPVLSRAFGVCGYWKNQHLPLGSVACSVPPETVLVPLLRRAPRSRAVAASPFSARGTAPGPARRRAGRRGADTCSSGLGLRVRWAAACTVCGFGPASLSVSFSPSFQNTQPTVFKETTQEASGRSLCCVTPSPVWFQNIPFPPEGDPVAMASPSPDPSPASGGHESSFCLDLPDPTSPVCGLPHDVEFRVWLLSPTIVFPGSVHGAAGVRAPFLFGAESYSPARWTVFCFPVRPLGDTGRLAPPGCRQRCPSECAWARCRGTIFTCLVSLNGCKCLLGNRET